MRKLKISQRSVLILNEASIHYTPKQIGYTAILRIEEHSSNDTRDGPFDTGKPTRSPQVLIIA